MANDGPTPAAGPPDTARPKEEGWKVGPDGRTWWYWSGDAWTSPMPQPPGLPAAIPTGGKRREDPATGIDWEWKGGGDGGWRPIDPPSSGVHALRHRARPGITKLPAESKSSLMTMRALLEPRLGVLWILFVVIIVILLAFLMANRGGDDPATAPTRNPAPCGSDDPLIVADCVTDEPEATVTTSPAGAIDTSGWSGTWEIWTEFGDTASIRFDPLDTTVAAFEASLPPWAERLRGLCDPSGDFYTGAWTEAGFDSEQGEEALGCEASAAAGSLFRERWALFGAGLSSQGQRLAVPGMTFGLGQLTLFGLGPTERFEDIPYEPSPTERYFWGGSITRTPTADDPQGTTNTTDTTWYGSCTVGACAGTRP